MSGHARRVARDHCLAPERVDAPISAGRYRSLFEDRVTEINSSHAS